MTAPHTFDFDTVISRKDRHAIKWEMFDEDVLPLWVADMDFRCPQPILDALHERVDHGIFGYTMPYDALREVLVERMQERYGWQIDPEHLLFNPGMVLTLNVVSQAVGKPGDGILMSTPVYGPFHRVPGHRGRFAQKVPLVRVDDDAHTFHYEIDFETFEEAITPQTSLFYLCDPHNPVGRAFRKDELEQLAEICLRHDVVIAADAIHNDLLMRGEEHIPIASLSPEIAQKTITMIAPTKTFNLPGLACSVSIVPDDELRQRMQHTTWFSGYHVDTLAFTAALAAYKEGDPWLRAALDYMTDNRDYAVQFLREHVPALQFTIPEATYLLWIDASRINRGDYTTPQEFFLKEAKVAMNGGDFFCDKHEEYVRLNYACPRSTLTEALTRIQAAVDAT